MSVRTCFCVLMLLLWWSAPPALDAGERLTMMVSPVQSFAPATLCIHVRLEPSTNNRALQVVADSIDFYRSSLLPLDGDRAPRVVTLDFRSVPSGQYEIRGILIDGAGREQASVRQQVTVISSGTDR